MSRLIVKGLPKNITVAKLRSLFESKGPLTDVQLKYTKDGVFRRFAFVGYETDEQAQAALEHFNNAFIQTSRLTVQPCAALGSQDKPQSWSKYSKESSAFRKAHGVVEVQNVKKYEKKPDRKNKKKERLAKLVEKHKDDPKFIEFMQVHAKDRMMWGNDAPLLTDSPEDNPIAKQEKTKKKESTKIINTEASMSDTEESSNDEIEEQNTEEESNEEFDQNSKLAEKEITDIDYMKSLMTKKSSNTDKKPTKNSINDELFTIKLYNLPYTVKREDIIRFFKPMKPFSVRLPTKQRGFCYVGFKTDKEFDRAWLKNKSFIKEKQIFFSDFTQKNILTINNSKQKSKSQIRESGKHAKWLKQEEALKCAEDISESGRIFFRNLAYTVNEDDMHKLFEQYGPVAEVDLPIDSWTRQIKGFGTVTYVMPEHAVRAFLELDGTLFHGRLLHLLPGKGTETPKDDAEAEGLSYQQKKQLELKKSARQSHNWNTLFLGANAVANLLAKRFNTSKETILDSNAGGSNAAVRLALGETQVVMEMKKFLEDNDVQLNVFDAPVKNRSKTVILAKNLAFETKVSDLAPLFSKYGLIGRIVLPPSGVTALIEFLEPSEARKAFQELAYINFKNLPLLLEWAPENTFKTKVGDAVAKMNESDNIKETKENENKKNVRENNIPNTKSLVAKEEKGPSDDDHDENPEPETTLFLRNLNFKTREDAIRAHFKHLGAIHMIQVAMRKDPDDPKTKVSLGYAFIQFKKRRSTENALKTMQFTQIEGNEVELKRSDRILKSNVRSDTKKSATASKQTGSKILVRNIPFQAKPDEVRDIFKAFGELKSVRLPKKMTPGEEAHRGFGFVDFISKSDAKKAFDTLSQSSHLYGRRLALEWAAADDNNVDELRKRTAKSFDYAKPSKVGRKGVFDTSVVDNVDNNDED